GNSNSAEGRYGSGGAGPGSREAGGAGVAAVPGAAAPPRVGAGLDPPAIPAPPGLAGREGRRRDGDRHPGTDGQLRSPRRGGGGGLGGGPRVRARDHGGRVEGGHHVLGVRTTRRV